jgi:uncharacterized protein (TIGR00251 family)
VTPPATTPWRIDGDRLLLHVRAAPRAGKDALDRISLRDDGRAELRVKLRAAPADGEANAALIRLMAKLLDIPTRDVALIAGETARAKALRLPLAAEARLEALAAALPIR